MSKSTVLIGLAAVLLAGSGCTKSNSEPPPDTGAWKADLAETGVHPSNWSNYVYVVNAELCDGDYGYVVALWGHLAADRIGIKYACPEHLDEWDKAVGKLNAICSTPRDQLSDEDRQTANAACTR